jgi:hypothetical protein
LRVSSTNLVDDLSLLSSSQNTRVGNSSVDSSEQLLVKWDSRGNNDLNLTLVGSDQLGELLDNGWEDTESVVLSENLKEVLDLLSTLLWKSLEQLGDDGLLVGVVEGWGSDHWAELSILLEELSESTEGLCDGIQLGSLLSGGVLYGCNFSSVIDLELMVPNFPASSNVPLAHRDAAVPSRPDEMDSYQNNPMSCPSDNPSILARIIVTYQSGSIGTINTIESDWWLDGLGSVCAERGDAGTAEDVACGEHCDFLI